MQTSVSHLVACAYFLAIPSLAHAQAPQGDPVGSPSGVPPRLEMTVELGLMGGIVDLSDLHGDPQTGLSGVGAGVRVRLTPRIGVGIRGLVAIGGEVANSQVYDVATIIHLTSSRRSHRFLRFGAGGHHEVRDIGESRRTNQDHSTTVFPAYRHHRLTYPNFFVAGAGFTRVVSRMLGITAEVDAVTGPGVGRGLGMRASAGLTVPLGACWP